MPPQHTHTHDGGILSTATTEQAQNAEVSATAANAVDKQRGERPRSSIRSQHRCPDLQRRVEGREPAPDNINLACYYLQRWKTTVWQSLT